MSRLPAPRYPVCGTLKIPISLAEVVSERVWCLLDRTVKLQTMLENAYLIGLMDGYDIFYNLEEAENYISQITTA